MPASPLHLSLSAARRRGAVLIAAVLLAGGVMAAHNTAPSGADPGGVQLTVDPECTIEDQTVLLDPDDGRSVDLDVLVLLDGVSQADAETVFADVAKPYAERNLNVVATYQLPTTPFTGTDANSLIGQAKNQFPDRKVPAGYDMVEVLTSRNITLAGDATVAGLADCIGGVRDKAHAFEVSESGTAAPSGSSAAAAQSADIGVPNLPIGKKKAAKVTAHEMGHLFGGQHHYANCVEGLDPATETSDLSPCTLMINDVSLASLHFSTVNGALVRGYALRYADAA